MAGELPVKIDGAWLRAMPPGSDATAAYMVLTNTGDQPLRVTGGSTPIAGMVIPMIGTRRTVDGKTVFGMKGTDALVIPARGTLELKPGGDHLMVMNLKSHPHPGDKVKFTIAFDGGTVDLELPVSMDQPAQH